MIRFKIIFVISLLLFILLGIWDLTVGISRIWYLIPFTFFLLCVVVGSFSMSYNMFLTAFTRKQKPFNKHVALTFDDGPNIEYTPKVLRLLKDYNAKATFFCIGRQIEKHPDILKQIHESGHLIGNHSYSHNNYIGFSKTSIWLKEINKTDTLIEKEINIKNRLFRPPFGVTTPNLARAIQQSKHLVIGWNIRPFDTTTKNPNEVLNRILNKIESGSIILLHDTHNRIPFILEHLLSYLEKNNYKTVTIEALMNETSN